MFPNISGATQQYLADVGNNQNEIENLTGQISSGISVERPSDNPAVINEILQLQAELSNNQQIQTNLGNVTTEVSAADSALQTAVQAIENAISLAAEGANSSQTASARASLAQQVSAIQSTLVGITQTSVDGRYIFSGDQDNQPPYQLDPSQPEGVQQLVTSASTRVIQSVDGTTFAVAKTAQEIFDPQNPDSTPATGNTFAAVQDLITALNNNDSAGITTAQNELKSADSYLNDQLAFYGEVEDRVQEATSLAQKFQTQQQTELGNLRDTDIPTAATALTELQTQQQASMEVEASVSQMKTLFSFLA